MNENPSFTSIRNKREKIPFIEEGKLLRDKNKRLPF